MVKMVTKNVVITDKIVTLVTDSDNRPNIHMDGYSYTGHSSHDCEFFNFIKHLLTC